MTPPAVRPTEVTITSDRKRRLHPCGCIDVLAAHNTLTGIWTAVWRPFLLCTTHSTGRAM